MSCDYNMAKKPAYLRSNKGQRNIVETILDLVLFNKDNDDRKYNVSK